MKLAVLSDLDPTGSGYLNIITPLCNGLADKGHDVKAIGFGYKGQEHWNKFSIIPANNLREVIAILSNLANLWGFDAFIVAMDIPVQEQVLLSIPNPKPFKYIGIMPIEADPLCLSWAMVLMQMDKQFVISQFGVDEAAKVGIQAEHLEVGIDSDAWRVPTQEEKSKLRKAVNIPEEAFVVLTVADNQERKNLAKGMEIFKEFAQDKKEARYVIVTREHNPVGWKLRDLAQEMGINDKLVIFERGMPFKQLWAMYAIADVFFLPSKAEGFGMPLLEAMSVGLPCVGTNCTAIAELLGEGRGYLADYDYVYRDPFGNGKRCFINQEHAVRLLEELYGFSDEIDKEKLHSYAVARPWQIAIDHLDKVLKEVVGKE